MKSEAHEFASPDMLVLECIFPDVDVVHELEYEAKGKTGRRVDADEGNEAIIPEPIAGDSLVTEPLPVDLWSTKEVQTVKHTHDEGWEVTGRRVESVVFYCEPAVPPHTDQRVYKVPGINRKITKELKRPLF